MQQKHYATENPPKKTPKTHLSLNPLRNRVKSPKSLKTKGKITLGGVNHLMVTLHAVLEARGGRHNRLVLFTSVCPPIARFSAQSEVLGFLGV